MSAQLVYISIGNSDDGLTQREWSEFVEAVRTLGYLTGARVHADCASAASSPYQNAVLAVEFEPEDIPRAMADLREIARTYRQDSIAWAPATVEFITPGEAA